MPQFVAIGPQGSQRWSRPIPLGRSICLGRAPHDGWAVPWDMRISREHCELTFDGDKVHVRCLKKALNPAYKLGEVVKEFTIGPGETFRIGLTTFRVDAESGEDGVGKIKVTGSTSSSFDPIEASNFPVVEFVAAEAAVTPRQVSEIDAEVLSLREEVSALRSQLQAERSAQTVKRASRTGLTNEVAHLQDVVRRLNDQLEATQKVAEAERVRCESATRESAELQKEIDKLRSQLRESNAAQAFAEVAEQMQSEQDSVDMSDGESTRERRSTRDKAASEGQQAEATPPPLNDKLKGLSALKARLSQSSKERLQ